MLDSGILLASIAAVALNAFFNSGNLVAELQSAPPHEADRIVIADHRLKGRPVMQLISLNTYGKGRVRVMRVHRDGDYNEVRELDLTTMLEGDFAAVLHRRRQPPGASQPTRSRTSRTSSRGR